MMALSQPYRLGGSLQHSTPSLGIALFAGGQADADELLRQADLAMYQAKAEGRNSLRFFDPRMQTVVNARAALQADLREALQTASSRCTSSRRSTTPAASPVAKPCCAGSTRCAASCRRPNSSLWQRKAA
jgi:hypothetical protein